MWWHRNMAAGSHGFGDSEIGGGLKRNPVCSSHIIVQVVILLSFLWMSGCGYQLQATKQPKGMSIPSLAIPLMASPSSSLGFESDFTMMIRKEFVSQSQIPLVSRDQAAFVLIGNVSDITTEPLSYRVTDGTFEVTSSRWLKIRLSARLLNRTTGEIVWNEEAMDEKAAFTVDSDPLRTRYNQRKAARRIAQLLAERIYLRTMERF
ncbi:MAG TPA: hypothetical protein ENO25_05590 [Desulfobacteraceae bacterium]|nr:hypothetical protein [Desulfobacteraceae bacterium]